MAAAALYNFHTRRDIVLAQTERDAIASSPSPIYIFWVNLINISNPDKWPEQRRYTAVSKKTTTGVFVTYQSDLEPLPSFGLPGDLWATSDKLYFKEMNGDWILWSRSVEFRSPFEEARRLVWSRNALFKYLSDETVRTESLRWQKSGVPCSSIPTYVREQASVVQVLQKEYKELTEADCVFLLNTHLNHIRNPQPSDVGNRPAVVIPRARPVDILPRSSRSDGDQQGFDEEQLYHGNNTNDVSEQCLREGSEALCQTSQQPMYKPFPVQQYRTPRDHHQSEGHVTCWNGMEAFLPPDHKGSDGKEGSHVTTCKWLLSGSDATATPTPAEQEPTIDDLPIVAVVEVPPDGCHISVWNDYVDEVRCILSSGRMVALVCGDVEGPAYSWDEESLESACRRQSDGAMLHWQSARVDEEFSQRNEAPPTLKGTIKDFMKAEEDPTDSVNCLDIPTFGGEVPAIIRELATSSRALCSTAGVTFELSEAEPQQLKLSDSKLTASGNGNTKTHKNGKRSSRKHDMPPSAHPSKRQRTDAATHIGSTGSENTDTTASPRMRTHEKKDLDEILDKPVTQVNANGGMHSIEWDVVRPVSWVIIASSGAVTKTHHDAGGYLTFGRCELGSKAWAIVRQKKKTRGMVESMKAYHRIATICTETSKLAEFTEPRWVYLPRGTLLIQHPGAFHAVYTLERSIFTCGHFYMFESMHLTEVARACAAYTKQRGTNASHPGSIRMLSRIALSLVFDWRSSVLRKPFISLARMLLWYQIYAPGDVDPDDPTFTHDQESKAELAAAQAVAEAITEYNGLSLEDIKPEPLRCYHWLSSIGEGSDWTDWREPGTAKFNVPDIRSRFEAFKDVQLPGRA